MLKQASCECSCTHYVSYKVVFTYIFISDVFLKSIYTKLYFFKDINHFKVS